MPSTYFLPLFYSTPFLSLSFVLFLSSTYLASFFFGRGSFYFSFLPVSTRCLVHPSPPTFLLFPSERPQAIHRSQVKLEENYTAFLPFSLSFSSFFFFPFSFVLDDYYYWYHSLPPSPTISSSLRLHTLIHSISSVSPNFLISFHRIKAFGLRYHR